jgi:hypothetical protein
MTVRWVRLLLNLGAGIEEVWWGCCYTVQYTTPERILWNVDSLLICILSAVQWWSSWLTSEADQIAIRIGGTGD